VYDVPPGSAPAAVLQRGILLVNDTLRTNVARLVPIPSLITIFNSYCVCEAPVKLPDNTPEPETASPSGSVVAGENVIVLPNECVTNPLVSVIENELVLLFQSPSPVTTVIFGVPQYSPPATLSDVRTEPPVPALAGKFSQVVYQSVVSAVIPTV